MAKKNLPKAIRRTTERGRQETSAQAAVMNEPAEDQPAAPRVDRRSELVEVVPPLQPLARTLPSRLPAPAEANAVRRLSQAQAIVERHATYSAAGGLIPVPIVNVASVTAIILRMVK